jgi:hypothetical protein
MLTAGSSTIQQLVALKLKQNLRRPQLESQYILTRLFQVGIFLAFINVIAETGTFAVIAGVAENG